MKHADQNIRTFSTYSDQRASSVRLSLISASVVPLLGITEEEKEEEEQQQHNNNSSNNNNNDDNSSNDDDNDKELEEEVNRDENQNLVLFMFR